MYGAAELMIRLRKIESPYTFHDLALFEIIHGIHGVECAEYLINFNFHKGAREILKSGGDIPK
jgi:hypothetical protein